MNTNFNDMTPTSLLTAQKIISTRHFQSQFSAMVKAAEENGNYYNVVRNSESIGVFIPKDMWEDLLEDMEAMSSKRYLEDIKNSRQQHKKGETVDFNEVFKA